MLKARHTTINFQFKFPAGTSRGILHNKSSSFLILEENETTGIGECSIIPGLSIDPPDGYQQTLEQLCSDINRGKDITQLKLPEFPSIAFGLETAVTDLKQGGSRKLFQNSFSEGKTGIPINGLVWMGNKEFMRKQIHEKIDTGFRCIKIKVGALELETELAILADIRKEFSPDDIEIRLDANGGFNPGNGLENLKLFSEYHIHSIEQPIKPLQWEEMAVICEKSPIPIALDEELIGISPSKILLEEIKPHFIILKPSLIGGFTVAEQWITLAEKNNIEWWITSALESNVGLNAIAQWTASLHTALPQGLGTGMLYENNIPSPLEIKNAQLFYNRHRNWDLSSIL
ncbi:MAG: o-succinylbenzoate synthase [Bacteroidia bacterium]|nr:o-succinylbenzoate synthase [Bacteroidia bacterium]